MHTFPKDAEKTHVTFRKFEDGDVIAIFPSIKFDYNGNVLSYMHIGQHGGANVSLANDLPKAKPREYSALYTELESIGYNLNVI